MRAIKNSLKFIFLFSTFISFTFASGNLDGTFFFKDTPNETKSIDPGFNRHNTQKNGQDLLKEPSKLNRCFNVINKYKKSVIPLIAIHDELDIKCSSNSPIKKLGMFDKKTKSSSVRLPEEKLQSLNIDRLYIVSRNSCYDMDTRVASCLKIKSTLEAKEIKIGNNVVQETRFGQRPTLKEYIELKSNDGRKSEEK